MTVSLCMIVKNEEEVLGRCLDSVAGLVDEIIVVDTGSTDHTKEIAARYTSQIFNFDWVDDFATARNYSFSLASGDYCLWLDADDVITPEDARRFAALRNSLSPTAWVVMLPYHIGFDQQGNLTFSYYRERLIKNHVGLRWEGAVHEVITPAGEIVYGDCAITHHKLHPGDPTRNLRILEAQLAREGQLEPRQQFYFGRELYYHQQYHRALETLEDFLTRPGAWLENKLDACCHCAYCHYALGEPELAAQSLLRTLSYALPRAEVCCDLGKHFLEREQWQQAAFWYTLATTCHRDDRRGGFVAPECYDYLPCIQLCVCYSHMGELEKAARFNELAAQFRPNSPAVQHNRAYFATKFAATST